MDSYLKDSGYVQSNADPCIYDKAENGDGKYQHMMLMALYVDDLVLATNSCDMLEREKKEFKDHFEMEDQGEIHYCLGISIKRNRDSHH